MEILGIGPLELTLILIIALIVLGPNDLVKTGRTLGRWMRKVVMSQEWKVVQNASRELRTLPNKLIRDAGIEEAQRVMKEQMSDVNKISRDIQGDFQNIQTDLSTWVTPSQTDVAPQVELENEPSPDNPNLAEKSSSEKS